MMKASSRIQKMAAHTFTRLTLIFCSVICVTPCSGGIKSFPGAEGFGALTPAGRYGQIIKVTNLKDSGPGSLRAAIETPGPRIIVFEAGGGIQLQSPLVVQHPFLTVAGQTAPFPGISMIGFGLRISTHDILIQHLYLRITNTTAEDGIQLKKSAHNKKPYNIVIDHVSVAWANDENISCFHDSSSNVTFSHCLLAEGHYGMLIDEGSWNISILRNLFMSAKERHPRIKGRTFVQIVNNLSYNVGSHGSTVVGSKREGALVSFAGNQYLDGPDTGPNSYGVRIYDQGSKNNRLFVPREGRLANLATRQLYPLGTNEFIVAEAPVPLTGVTILPAVTVEAYILANAGARPVERMRIDGDAVDRRLIMELVQKGGRVKDRKKPAYIQPAASYRPFAIPADPHGDVDGDGYTNIEDLLQKMAGQVER